MAPHGMAYHIASEGAEAIVEIERNTTTSKLTTVIDSASGLARWMTHLQRSGPPPALPSRGWGRGLRVDTEANML